MATFVHLFPAEAQKKIITSGIKLNKIHCEEISKGVFCMPVIQDFYATHQWVRELMRVHKNLLAVYFRIPDTQEVWYGHFNKAHEKMMANCAIENFSKLEDKMGYQVILPQAVDSDEIIRIKKLPPMGWRYYPEAKGKKLTCLCPMCITKGEYGKNALLQSRLLELEKKFFAAVSPEDQASAISAISEIVGDHRLKLKSWPCKRKKKGKDLCVKKRNHKDNLEKAVTEFVVECLKDPVKVNKAAADTILYYEQRTGDNGLKSLDMRIANANNEVANLTDAFVLAKNDLLRMSIEKKMGALETYLKDLNGEKAKIQIERGAKITKGQILEFVAQLIKGDPNDKDYQRRIIDKLVHKVYISNGNFCAFVSICDINKTEDITFEDIKNETAQRFALNGSFSNSIGAPITTRQNGNALPCFYLLKLLIWRLFCCPAVLDMVTAAYRFHVRSNYQIFLLICY